MGRLLQSIAPIPYDRQFSPNFSPVSPRPYLGPHAPSDGSNDWLIFIVGGLSMAVVICCLLIIVLGILNCVKQSQDGNSSESSNCDCCCCLGLSFYLFSQGHGWIEERRRRQANNAPPNDAPPGVWTRALTQIRTWTSRSPSSTTAGVSNVNTVFASNMSNRPNDTGTRTLRSNQSCADESNSNPVPRVTEPDNRSGYWRSFPWFSQLMSGQTTSRPLGPFDSVQINTPTVLVSTLPTSRHNDTEIYRLLGNQPATPEERREPRALVQINSHTMVVTSSTDIHTIWRRQLRMLIWPWSSDDLVQSIALGENRTETMNLDNLTNLRRRLRLLTWPWSSDDMIQSSASDENRTETIYLENNEEPLSNGREIGSLGVGEEQEVRMEIVPVGLPATSTHAEDFTMQTELRIALLAFFATILDRISALIQTLAYHWTNGVNQLLSSTSFGVITGSVSAQWVFLSAKCAQIWVLLLLLRMQLASWFHNLVLRLWLLMNPGHEFQRHNSSQQIRRHERLPICYRETEAESEAEAEG